MQMDGSEFILRQTTEQTMDILLDTDYLTKFIRIYTYEDDTLIPDEFTTAEEIYQRFVQYMDDNGNIIADNEITIKRRIGTTIKNIYNIRGKLSDSEMYNKKNNEIASYRVKIKSLDEVNKEFRQVYIIEEGADLVPVERNKDFKIIYDKINNGVNSINLLNKALPNQNNYKLVKQLVDLGLIKKTSEYNLNDTLD